MNPRYLQVKSARDSLMERLNAGKFRCDEWVEFINFARGNGYMAMADDMELRLNYYKKQTKLETEKTCITKQSLQEI